MDILNQKLGDWGNVHIRIVNGKVIVGLDGEQDLVVLLGKLKKGHEADLIGKIVDVAGAIIQKISEEKPALPPQ